MKFESIFKRVAEVDWEWISNSPVCGSAHSVRPMTTEISVID